MYFYTVKPLCTIATTYLPTGIEANEAESTTSNKK